MGQKPITGSNPVISAIISKTGYLKVKRQVTCFAVERTALKFDGGA
jgi:hypothetical protein